MHYTCIIMVVKKTILPISAFLLGVGLYLWFSYANFYNTIGLVNLKSPYTTSRIVLKNPEGKDKAKYVVLGDSLGAGVGAKSVEETYPYLMAKKLVVEYQEVEVINLSVPGAMSKDVLKDQLEPTLKENPDYVSLLVGINDIHNRVPLANFSLNYQNILETLKIRTKAKIVVINLPYLGSKIAVRFPFSLVLDKKTQEFNRIINSLVDQNNPRFVLVDLYSATKDAQNQPIYYAPDNFHPSGAGYTLWSKTINVAL